MVVCSDHFKDTDYKLSNHGDKTIFIRSSVPSQKLPKTVFEKRFNLKRKTKRTTKNSARASIELGQKNATEADVTMGNVAEEANSKQNNADVLTEEVVRFNNLMDNLNDGLELLTMKDASVTAVPETETIGMQTSFLEKPDTKSIGIQTTFLEKRNSFSELSDMNLTYFTGLERERFLILYRMIEKFSPMEERLLWCKTDALVITLHKCRHNLDFKMMEFIFGVDRRWISKIFKEVIQKLYFVLKLIDIWEISFGDPKSYRCILDYTEFYVTRAGDPSFHQLTFSSYKHHPTFKLLVACDEKGGVNFISDAFVGATSDREIFLNSGLLDKLKKGDAVLADKGFDISDLLESKGVIVNIPPFLKGKQQLSNFEVMKTRIIANKRTLIENINCRAKKNRILVTALQNHIWPYADKVIYVCFALVNFYKPLVTD